MRRKGQENKKNESKRIRLDAKQSAAAGEALFFDIVPLIEQSRRNLSVEINREMILLYWQIGRRIKKCMLGDQKAEYGKSIVEKLAELLQSRYGRGFSKSNLFNMLQCHEVFPSDQIFQTLSGKLCWSHLLEIIHIKDELKRKFYLEMCGYEKWSVRILKDRIRSMLFERTAISKKPEQLIERELAALRNKQEIGGDLVFRDPYFLDFLGLANTYSERDLENCILHQLSQFLVEFGSDFAFLGRQKRITIDNADHYIDLLFYHRGLRALVVIELKLGRFQAEHKGQVELYLRYLEKYEMRKGENPPVALILCAEKSREEIELLRLDEERINVAEYWTKLPPQKLLEEELHRAVLNARERLSVANDGKSREAAEVIRQESPAGNALRELLTGEKHVTPARARQRLQLTLDQLRRLVRQGKSEGWLHVEGTGRATCYRLKDGEAAE